MEYVKIPNIYKREEFANNRLIKIKCRDFPKE